MKGAPFRRRRSLDFRLFLRLAAAKGASFPRSKGRLFFSAQISRAELSTEKFQNQIGTHRSEDFRAMTKIHLSKSRENRFTRSSPSMKSVRLTGVRMQAPFLMYFEARTRRKGEIENRLNAHFLTIKLLRRGGGIEGSDAN